MQIPVSGRPRPLLASATGRVESDKPSETPPSISLARTASDIGPGQLRRAVPLGRLGPRQPVGEIRDKLDALERSEMRYANVFRQVDMPPAAQLQRVVDMAKLANFVYARDTAMLPRDFHPSAALMLPLAQEMNLPTGGQVPLQQGRDPKMEGTVADERTGLVASILVSPSDKRVVLSFGGTTAGLVPGGASERLTGDAKMGLPQWRANGEAGLGLEPASYRQAVALAGGLQKLLANSRGWETYELSMTGHSKGGGEASYASLMMERPVRATVFSPAPLSDGLLNNVPVANVRRALALVSSYSVKGDPVPALGDPGGLANRALERLAMPHPRAVGTAHVFDPDANLKFADPVDRIWPMYLHDMFLQQLESHQRAVAQGQSGSEHPIDA